MSDFFSIVPGIPGVPGAVGLVGSTDRGNAVGPHFNGRAKAASMIEVSDRMATDRVEISQGARRLEMLDNVPQIRSNRLEQIRQAIDDGTYESDDKIDVAIERLVSHL